MNYILFFPDEMRAESLHCYGNPDVHTPSIDALAAEGTRFDCCYTAHPVCTASRISIMTGCYPHVHGYRSLKHFLHAGDHTFVNAMKDQGYTTWFAGKSDCWEREGTEAAFDKVLSSLNWDFFDLEKTKQAYLEAKANPKPEILPHEYTMLKEARPDEEIPNDRDYKLVIRTNGENELYDMLEDPLEYRNLYDDPAYREVRERLKDRMLVWSIHTADVTPYEGHVLP